MGDPSWRIPQEDSARFFEDEEAHRAEHGYCLSPCDHPECHDDTEHHENEETDQ